MGIKKAFAFFPHAFATKIGVTRTPRVRVSRKAYAQMYYLVDLAAMEVAWLGVVSQVEPHEFLIEEIFIFDQVVSGASARLEPTDIAATGEALLMTGDPENLRKVNSLFLWGHSHVNMPTGPSGQDESQLEEFGQNVGVQYMIRLIANKQGRLEFTFRDFEHGVKIRDIPWAVDMLDKDEQANIKSQFAAKVRTGRFTTGRGTRTDDYPADYGDGFEHVVQAGREMYQGVKKGIRDFFTPKPLEIPAPPAPRSGTEYEEEEVIPKKKKKKHHNK